MEKDIPCKLYSKESQDGCINITKSKAKKFKKKKAKKFFKILNFKAKKITGDKKGHCIIIKGSMNQEDIVILNVYVLIITSKT